MVGYKGFFFLFGTGGKGFGWCVQGGLRDGSEVIVMCLVLSYGMSGLDWDGRTCPFSIIVL